MRVIAIINLKGGSAKTTTTAFLAHRLADQESRRVVVVDADPQGSAMRWHGLADWPVPLLALPSTTLHRQLWGVVDRDRFDTIVIDTPPIEERGGIVASALRMATDVIVTMAPTMIELDRLSPAWTAIEDAAGNRDADLTTAAVLLNRCVPNAASTKQIRTAIEADGHHVLTAQVPRLEQYAQAFGVPVGKEAAYGAVAAELAASWGAA